MKSDYDKIMILINRNDYFYNKKLILKDEYIYNNLFLASKLECLLQKKESIPINDFLVDSFSLAKFKLSIDTLKTVPN